MPGYRDWDMLNQAITGLGDAAARRRQQNVVNQREAERIALEHEMRGQQEQREDRRDAESARRFTLQEQREDRRDKAASDQAALEKRRFELLNAPRSSVKYRDPITGIKGTMTGPDEAIRATAEEYEKKHGIKLEFGEYKSRAVLGVVEHEFDNPEDEARFAADALKQGVDVYKPGQIEQRKTEAGQELFWNGRQWVKGAPAPDPGSTTTTIKTEPPPAWAAPGTAPTSVTNTTTRVPNQPPSPTRAAQGGYKIGKRYKGGLIYLGGDPNNQNSWSRAE